MCLQILFSVKILNVQGGEQFESDRVANIFGAVTYTAEEESRLQLASEREREQSFQLSKQRSVQIKI